MQVKPTYFDHLRTKCCCLM